jgi:hypothetical protein
VLRLVESWVRWTVVVGWGGQPLLFAPAPDSVAPQPYWHGNSTTRKKSASIAQNSINFDADSVTGGGWFTNMTSNVPRELNMGCEATARGVVLDGDARELSFGKFA